MPGKKTGDWKKAKAELANLKKNSAEVTRQAMLQEAQFLRGKIIEGIDAQAPGGAKFKPLSVMTLAARRLAGFRGTKALIQSGGLRNSITVIVDADGNVAVGVDRKARSSGEDVANIAKIHEFGAGPYVVPITPAMMRFLGVLFKEAGLDQHQSARGTGKGYLVVRIPPRPFIRPVFDKWAKPADVKKRLQERISKIMGQRSTKR